MLIFFWMMACGPSQDQLDCLSECVERKSEFPGMEVCIKQQHENENGRKQTIADLQNVLKTNKVKYTKSKKIFQSYNDQCLGILNSNPTNPKAAAKRYMALCEGSAYDRIAPHNKRTVDYEKNEEKLKKFMNKSEEFNNSGGAEKACDERKIESEQINCEQECDNK